MTPRLLPLRLAARRLRRAPGFTAATAVTVALGIGVTTAAFSMVDHVLLRPLPYPDADRLVEAFHTLQVTGISRVDQSDASFLYYRQTSREFSRMGAYRVASVNLGPVDAPSGAADATRPERVEAGFVSAGLLPTLEVAPMLGRGIAADDDLPGAPPVVLLSEQLWRRTYAADPGIVGRRIVIDGVPRAVIGVMPEDFRFPTADARVWLPLALDPSKTESASFDYRAVGRLKARASVASATADLDRLLPRLPEAFPGRLTASSIEATHMHAAVRPLREAVVGDIGPVLWVVLGAGAFVLLVACASVANLFLVRAEARRKEMAVRRALGAGRGRIVGEFAAEGMVVAGLGGAAGAGLAAVALRALPSVEAGVEIPRLAEVRMDAAVLLFAAATTMLAALVFSALPALRRGAPLTEMLAGTSRGATTGRDRQRVRSGLVVAQVALALVLLAGSGLMARSFAKLRSVNPGFEAAHALSFRVALPAAEYAAPGDAARFFTGALDDIAAAPGVVAAGVVSRLPLEEDGEIQSGLFVEDQPLPSGVMPAVEEVAYATPGAFPALGIRLLSGRLYGPPDPDREMHEVVVSRSLAERYWTLDTAVGRRLRTNQTGTAWYTVVGVVRDVRGASLDAPAQPIVYYPLVTGNPLTTGDPDVPWTPASMSFVVRTVGAPAQAAAPARSAIRRLDPTIPMYRLRPMAELLRRSTARTSFTLLLLTLAAVVTLVLGCVGIYGVLAYAVRLRAREIAVRLALGALPAQVLGMVTRQGLAVAAVGVALGLAASVALTRGLSALLYDVSPTDPVVLLGAAAVLLAAAAAASWLPARRAARVEVADVLRDE